MGLVLWLVVSISPFLTIILLHFISAVEFVVMCAVYLLQRQLGGKLFVMIILYKKNGNNINGVQNWNPTDQVSILKTIFRFPWNDKMIMALLQRFIVAVEEL